MTDLVTLHVFDRNLTGGILNDLCRRHDAVMCRRVDGALVFSVTADDSPTATPDLRVVEEPATPVENPAPAKPAPAPPRVATRAGRVTAGKRAHDQAVLDCLAVNPPMRPAEIIAAASIPRGSSTSILNRLETAGRIERTADGRWKLAATSIRTTATVDPPPTATAGRVGVDAGPMQRRPFDADAARRRAAEGV